ncbi:unnamed protein product [Malus baccata var. baccata]
MVKGGLSTTLVEECPDGNTSLSLEPLDEADIADQFLFVAFCQTILGKYVSSNKGGPYFDALCYMRTSKFEYAAFEEKVNRTIYLDNISPQVTESVVKTALSQFGTVKSVQFIPNYFVIGKEITEFRFMILVLVEMENLKEASVIGKEITEFRFMILGIPRLVRALSAAANMFDERPTIPRRQISRNSWRKKRSLQSEALKANYKKYERVDSMISDGTARCLSHLYKIRGADD